VSNCMGLECSGSHTWPGLSATPVALTGKQTCEQSDGHSWANFDQCPTVSAKRCGIKPGRLNGDFAIQRKWAIS
jgi:hypothetical protein